MLTLKKWLTLLDLTDSVINFDLLFELQVWRNVSGGAGAFTSRRLALCLNLEGVLNIRAAAVCIRMCSGSTSS